MATLTWRNVDAPNLGASLEGIRLFSGLLGNATNSIGAGLKAMDDQQIEAANRQLALNAAGRTNASSLNQGLQDQSIFGGVDLNRVDPNAINALSDRARQLQQLDNQGRQIDISGANSSLSALRFMNDTQQAAALDKRQRDAAAAAVTGLTGAYNSGDARDFIQQMIQSGADPRTIMSTIQTLEPKFGGLYGSLGSLPSDADLTQGNYDTVSFSDQLFNSLVQTESSGRRTAADGSTLYGPVTKSGERAAGPAQVMPGTAPEAARLAGLPWDEDRYKNDPDYNLAIGRAYFDKQMNDFGRPDQALAAYNAGPGATRSAIRQANATGNPDSWLSFLPEETQKYVPATLKRVQAGATTDVIDWNANRNVVGGVNVDAWDAAAKDNATLAEVKDRSSKTIGDVPRREINDAYAYLLSKDEGMTPAIAEQIIAGSVRNTSTLWNMLPGTSPETIDMGSLDAGLAAWRDGGILDNQTVRRELDLTKQEVTKATDAFNKANLELAQLRSRGVRTPQDRNRELELQRNVLMASDRLKTVRETAGTLVQPKPKPVETKVAPEPERKKELPKIDFTMFPY